MKAAMSADVPYWEAVDAEPMILAIVATETVLRNTIATVTAALLPGAVLGLPAMCTRTLPGNLLLVDLGRAPSLRRSVVLLLTLLALLVLLPPGLLLLFGGVVLLLALLALLILLPFGLLLPFRLRRLFLFRRFALFFLFIRLALPRVNRRSLNGSSKPK